MLQQEVNLVLPDGAAGSGSGSGRVGEAEVH